MDRETLIAALVGGLIATIPVVLSNAVQIILHASERRQKDREARIQAREKWTERDVLRLLDALDTAITVMSDVSVVEPELKSPDLAMHKLNKDLLDANNSITRLVWSLDDHSIYQAYLTYLKMTQEFVGDMSAFLESTEDKPYEGNYREKWDNVLEGTGKLQRALREKLISIRAG